MGLALIDQVIAGSIQAFGSVELALGVAFLALMIMIVLVIREGILALPIFIMLVAVVLGVAQIGMSTVYSIIIIVLGFILAIALTRLFSR